MADEQPATVNVDVVVPPEHETGVYANFAAVSSQSAHDVTLDFIQLVPGSTAPRPIVVARLKLAPTFLMPLMQVLSGHLAKHEEQLQRLADNDPPLQPPEEES
jgi:Protein of unknown function (DUF3467)